MIFSENLKISNILVRAKSRNRWDLIDELLSLAVRNREVKEEEREVLKKALVDREKSMSTGIGKGVSIPHCTTSKVNDIIIILATCVHGIDFDAIDNMPVKIAILLLVPKNKLTQHIKTLANIAKIMSSDDLRDAILSRQTPEEVLGAIQDHEKTVKK